MVNLGQVINKINEFDAGKLNSSSILTHDEKTFINRVITVTNDNSKRKNMSAATLHPLSNILVYLDFKVEVEKLNPVEKAQSQAAYKTLLNNTGNYVLEAEAVLKRFES